MTKLNVPRNVFPIPQNYTDVQKQTKTSLDVLQEATIGDYWNVGGDMSLSAPRIGVTRFVSWLSGAATHTHKNGRKTAGD